MLRQKPGDLNLEDVRPCYDDILALAMQEPSNHHRLADRVRPGDDHSKILLPTCLRSVHTTEPAGCFTLD